MGKMKGSSFSGGTDLSRLDYLLERIEAGQPYGDQTDIDVLLEEIVKRLEQRFVAKVDDILERVATTQIPPCNTCTGSSATTSEYPTRSRYYSPSSSPQRARKISSKPTSVLEPNMDILVHEAQDIVEDVIMTSMESVMDLAGKQKEQGTGFAFTPSRVAKEGGKKSWLHGRAGNLTHPLKNVAKTKAPQANMRVDENKMPHPYRKTTAKTDDDDDADYDEFHMAATTFYDSGFHRTPAMERRPQTQETLSSAPSTSKPRPYSTSHHSDVESFKSMHYTSSPSPRPYSSQPKGTLRSNGGTLNPTYTYILRSSVQRSIPKYLDQDRGQSNAALMHIFDDIRYAMADDNVEDIITDVVEKAFFENDDEGGSNEVQMANREQRDYEASSDGGRKRQLTKGIQRTKPMKTDADKPGKKAQQNKLQRTQLSNDSVTTEDTVFFRDSDLRDKTASWKGDAKNRKDEQSIRHDSNLNYLVRRALRRAVPKYTYNKSVSGALLQLADKIMDEVPLQQGSLSLNHNDIEFTGSDKEMMKEVPKSSRNVSGRNKPKEDLPWVTKGKTEKTTSSKESRCKEVKTRTEDLPWVSKGRCAKNNDDAISEELPWVKRGENATSSKVTRDSSTDMPSVRRGTPVTGKAVKKQTTIPVNEFTSRNEVSTQTSLRALCEECDYYPHLFTAGRSYNTNTNQSADSISLSSESSVQDEIFYDALCWPSDHQIIVDLQDDSMSFLKRFRLNLLFRKKKGDEKKFVSAVHKVIEARRSGCIDDDGNFVTSIPPPSPKNDGNKSPPATKPKPNKSVDKNGNKRESKKRGSSKRRRHHHDRDSYPLPEEDDGSEGYASASEMDNFEFNPTAFLERNRRSAENNRFYNKDDGEDADVESDSDGANSSSRRVRFSDDVQHFGDIVALGGGADETESIDNLDADDDEPDTCLLSLKSKIELFEKVGSNEFLDERSNQGSPPPDLPPENTTLPTKDRVKLFEDISSGKKPTTCAATHKTPRRAVDSCQFTQTQSKICFFEQLSEHK